MGYRSLVIGLAYSAYTIFFSTQILSDYFSIALIFFTLMYLTAYIKLRHQALINFLVLLIDLITKSFIIKEKISIQKLELDLHCVAQIFNFLQKFSITEDMLLYLGLHVASIYTIFNSRASQNEQNWKNWGPLMTQISNFLLPILMYVLSLAANSQYVSVGWALLACLNLLGKLDNLSYWLACFMIATENWAPIQDKYQIRIGQMEIKHKKIKSVILTILLLIILFLNVNRNPHIGYSRLSKNKAKKKQLEKRPKSQRDKIRLKNGQYTLLSTIILCLMTNSLGNILILLAVYTNIPHYKAKRFSYLMGMGLIVSIVLEPMQIAYFVYLYLIVLIIEEDLQSQYVVQFEQHTFSLFLHIYRVYIMLSHVSFLNFILGLIRNSSIVLITLAIRISFRYCDIVIVFLGTNDNYGLENSLLNLEALPDAILWVYLVLMCLHNPTETIKYPNSTLTNILLEYSFLNRFIDGLKILRFFNWISLFIFSMAMLSQILSLYLFLHIFLFTLILCIEMKSPENEYKNSKLRTIWIIVFYLTCIFIFTKYFYLLKQYQGTSQIIDTLVLFLEEHQYIFGLSDLAYAKEGFTLLQYFLYDVVIAMLASINIYIVDFKIYADYRAVIANNEQISPLLNVEDQIFSQTEAAKKKNIFYFYSTFIKPVNMHEFLLAPSNKRIKMMIRDCMIGVCFTVIVVGYYFESSNAKRIIYIPYFFVIGLYYFEKYYNDFNPNLNAKILSLLSLWSIIDFICTYLATVIIQIFTNTLISSFEILFAGYLVTVILNIAHHLYGCLPEVNEYQEQTRLHIICKLILSEKIQPLTLELSIIKYCSSICLALSLSLFFVNIFSPSVLSTIGHILLTLFLYFSRFELDSAQKWLLFLSLLGLFDIWNEDYIAYFTIMSISLFYCFKFHENQIKRKLEDSQQPQKIAGSHSHNIIKEKNIDKQDNYFMCYCTLVLYFPIIADLIEFLGAVWLSPSSISVFLILILMIKIIYELFFQKKQLTRFIYYTKITIFLIVFIDQSMSFIHIKIAQTEENISSFFTQAFGLFFIFTSFFAYMFITQRSDTYLEHAQKAKDYWQIKKQMVGELGSQLHNEKKLITLQKYYHAKQKLSEKVKKISEHLKLNGQGSYYQSVENLSKQKDSDPEYELYSNMLLFLSKQTLIECFKKLNQYLSVFYKDSQINNEDNEILTLSRDVRQDIYRDYRHNFQQVFMKIKNQNQLNEENDSNQQRSSGEQKLDIEKISEINKRYEQCYNIISKATSQFNPILRIIIQNMEIIGMGVVVGWNLFGGVYTIPTTLSIFGWAILLENRTNVVFWSCIMIYAGTVLILKQLFFFYFSSSIFFQFVFYYHPDGYLYELFVIIFSVIMVIFLQLGGIQEKNFSVRQSIIDSFYRSALNRAAKCSQLDKENQFMEKYKQLKSLEEHSFIYRVFAKARFKPGKDFYPLMSGVQLIILLYTFFFYDMMEFQSRKNRKSIEQILTVTQFSSHMVIALFIQIIIMVIDRLLVSLNLVNKNNQKLENFFFSFTFNVGRVKHEPPSQIQKLSSFDALLIIKYFFHLSLLFSINFFVYFYIPSAGLTRNFIPSCSDNSCSKSYFYLSIFLLLYLIYFMVSGLQIKHGFSRNKCKNVLMEKYHFINYYIYKAFTAIPFAWEFKKICDWTVTSTALPLFHWMKFEDINAKMYESKCEAEMIKIKPLGTPWNKYFLGPIGFLSILMLIFGPILMYSPANPFSIKDTIIGATAKLSLKMDDRYEYKFFSTSHSIINDDIANDFGVDLTDKNLFMVRMSQFPDENFLFSEPAIATLSKNINDTIQKRKNSHSFKFIVEFKIIEHEGGESMIQWASKTLNKQLLTNLYLMLTYETNQLTINQFFSPFPGEINPSAIIIKSPGAGEYYETSLITKNKKTGEQEIKPIFFYYLTSNKFKLGFGIVTFYLTYVLLFSRLFRFYLTESVNNTLYDGCYMESILMLCEAVRQARIVQDFEKEEKLYFQLIDLMRYPKALNQITGKFVDFRKKYIKI